MQSERQTVLQPLNTIHKSLFTGFLRLNITLGFNNHNCLQLFPSAWLCEISDGMQLSTYTQKLYLTKIEELYTFYSTTLI